MSNVMKIKCFVASIDNFNNEVFILKIKPTKRLPHFKPGQFLHLAIDPFDPSDGFWPESRVFSIASAPFDPEIKIAYAVKGVFTKRMRDEIYEGKEVWIKLPYGYFTIDTSTNNETVMVAGGTGITPFISFISAGLNMPNSIPMRLVYGFKKSEFFLFKNIIAEAIKSFRDFKVSIFCEEDIKQIEDFHIKKGKISFDSIWEISQDPHNSVYYLSGPIQMIKLFKENLMEKGIAQNRIRIDEWE